MRKSDADLTSTHEYTSQNLCRKNGERKLLVGRKFIAYTQVGRGGEGRGGGGVINDFVEYNSKNKPMVSGGTRASTGKKGERECCHI